MSSDVRRGCLAQAQTRHGDVEAALGGVRPHAAGVEALDGRWNLLQHILVEAGERQDLGTSDDLLVDRHTEPGKFVLSCLELATRARSP